MILYLEKGQKLADEIKTIVDQETTTWGIDVTAIKIQDIEIPADMKRVMAKQAEAERERRATIIRSQGELSAADNLEKAMAMLSKKWGYFNKNFADNRGDYCQSFKHSHFCSAYQVLEGFKKLAGRI